MSSATSFLLRLGTGVICLIALAIWWRRPAAEADALAPARPIPGFTSVSDRLPAASPNPDATTRNLLAKLAALLEQRSVRARESLLTFKDAEAVRRFRERAAAGRLTILGELRGQRTLRVRHASFRDLEAELLAHAGDYDGISANSLFVVPGVPAREARDAVEQVPFRNRTLDFVGIDARAQENAAWGRGITIAILDTGVSGDPTLSGGRLSALDVGYGTAPGTDRESGHGTAVAALAAGLSPDAPGVAPAANVLSIRVTDATGVSDLFTLAQAIVAATDAGARVINVSLGGQATAPLLSAAIAYAREQGAVIVAAAGNDQAAQLQWPAADLRVVSVGAVDAAGQQVLFSNSGPQLQVTAPGFGVQTAWLDGQRALVDGTSASAPLVAGAIAAVMANTPGMTAAAAAEIVLKTASDAGVPGDDPAFGRGILNLQWAMNYQRTDYADTAVVTHYFEAATNQMQFVVQNRGGQAVTGLSLDVNAGANPTRITVPSLMPGEGYLAKVPVSPQARQAGPIVYESNLVNPPGVNDAVPTNNQHRSVLAPPAN